MNTLNHLNRRQMLQRAGMGIGSLGLASLLQQEGLAAQNPLAAKNPHFKTKAKSVIWLFINGGPSHVDTWDYKPGVRAIHGQELPESIRNGQRITTMTSGQKSFPCVAPMFQFRQYGQNGTWVSEILPHTAKLIDDISVVKSVHTRPSTTIRPSRSSTRVYNSPAMPAWERGSVTVWEVPIETCHRTS